MRIVRGGWLAFYVGRVDFRLHWSLPLVALFVQTGHWIRSVSFVLLLLAHELGHAALMKRYRLRVETIELTGVMGFCRGRGYAAPHEQNVIAWGGVLVQATLYGLALVLFPLMPEHHPLQAARLIFQEINLAMLLINLVPMHPLDGARAWYVLPPLLRQVFGRRKGRASRNPSDTRWADAAIADKRDDDDDPPLLH